MISISEDANVVEIRLAENGRYVPVTRCEGTNRPLYEEPMKVLVVCLNVLHWLEREYENIQSVRQQNDWAMKGVRKEIPPHIFGNYRPHASAIGILDSTACLDAGPGWVFPVASTMVGADEVEGFTCTAVFRQQGDIVLSVPSNDAYGYSSQPFDVSDIEDWRNLIISQVNVSGPTPVRELKGAKKQKHSFPALISTLDTLEEDSPGLCVCLLSSSLLDWLESKFDAGSSFMEQAGASMVQFPIDRNDIYTFINIPDSVCELSYDEPDFDVEDGGWHFPVRFLEHIPLPSDPSADEDFCYHALRIESSGGLNIVCYRDHDGAEYSTPYFYKKDLEDWRVLARWT